MTIYQVTYLSDNYRVKGFLALPDSIAADGADDRAVDAGWLASQAQHHWTIDTTVDETAIPLGQVPSVKTVSLRRPALIYCRGGIGRVGMVRLEWVKLFASMGYVIFAPAYRGNLGGEGRDEFGGADREDVHAAFRLLQSLPMVDASRISLMGFSRGSVNAALTATQVPGVHRLIFWGGVSDLGTTYEERIDLRRMLKRVIGGTPTKVPSQYEARSPILLADRIPCPTLIVHGTADVQVDYGHGYRMYERLKEMHRPVSMHSYEGLGHHVPSPVHEAVVERMFDWLEAPLS